MRTASVLAAIALALLFPLLLNAWQEPIQLPACDGPTYAVPTYDALAAAQVDSEPWLYLNERVERLLDSEAVERLSGLLDAALASDPDELPDAQRVALQNDLWGVAQRLQALDLSSAARSELLGRTERLVDRLALDAGALAAMSGAALPDMAIAILGEGDWSEVESEIMVLNHERAFGLRRVFRIMVSYQRRALVSQLVAIDDRGRPHLTNILGEIELLDVGEAGPSGAQVWTLDRARLGCGPVEYAIVPHDEIAHIPSEGANRYFVEFDPPELVSSVPCTRCHHDPDPHALIMTDGDPSAHHQRILDQVEDERPPLPPDGAARDGLGISDVGWSLAEATLDDGRTYVLALSDQDEQAAGRQWRTGAAHYEHMGFHPPGVRLGLREGDSVRLLRDSWVSIFDRTRAVEGMSEELIDLSSCVAWPRPVARTQALGDGQGLLLGAVCLDAGGREIEVTALLVASNPLERVRIGSSAVAWTDGGCSLRAVPEYSHDAASERVSHLYRGTARWVSGDYSDLRAAERTACESWSLEGQMLQSYGAERSWLPAPGAALEPTEVIQVDDVESFYSAIGSNRILEMAPGDYDLLDPIGSRPTINDVENLTIRGAGAAPDGGTHLVMGDELLSVLTLSNVRNVMIEGVRMGHGESAGVCMGNVLTIVGSAGVTVRNSLLYGSGAYGVWAQDSSMILLEDAFITECTAAAARFQNVANAHFAATDISNNRGRVLIELEEATLSLDRGFIQGNQMDAALFESLDGSILDIQGTTLEEGQAPTERLPD